MCHDLRIGLALKPAISDDSPAGNDLVMRRLSVMVFR